LTLNYDLLIVSTRTLIVNGEKFIMKNVIITLIIGFIVFEVIEHLVIPLFCSIRNRKKKSVSGVNGMLGEVVEVKWWEGTEGQVFIKGELWRAVSDVLLLKGDRAVIQNVEGLTLRVKPLVNSIPLEN
jgi:membrane-bound ClpP family serine protease